MVVGAAGPATVLEVVLVLDVVVVVGPEVEVVVEVPLWPEWIITV
jgi:hypothetical protein